MFAEGCATKDGRIIASSRPLISRSDEDRNKSKHKACRIKVGQKEWLRVCIVREDALHDFQSRDSTQ